MRKTGLLVLLLSSKARSCALSLSLSLFLCCCYFSTQLYCRQSFSQVFCVLHLSWFMEGRRRGGRSVSAALALILCFATAMGGGLVGIAQEKEGRSLLSSKYVEGDRWVRAAASRRRLTGLGSSPPTCRWRCGQCAPCRPVHMAIQPGLSVPLEYYPEAWRCKCADKFFMP